MRARGRRRNIIGLKSRPQGRGATSGLSCAPAYTVSSTWDNQFYPDGIPGAEVMANANVSGGLELAKDYFVSFPDGYRAHQIRLEGGDCSTDSFCYPSV
jgi:selenium binding protein SBP56